MKPTLGKASIYTESLACCCQKLGLEHVYITARMRPAQRFVHIDRCPQPSLPTCHPRQKTKHGRILHHSHVSNTKTTPKRGQCISERVRHARTPARSAGTQAVFFYLKTPHKRQRYGCAVHRTICPLRLLVGKPSIIQHKEKRRSGRRAVLSSSLTPVTRMQLY